MQLKDVSRRLLAVILVGLVIRYALAPFLTYSFDVTGWALISENILSGNGLYDVDGYYYSPVWGYVMGFFVGFEELVLGLTGFSSVAPDFFFIEYTGQYYNADVTTLGFNLFIKTIFFIFDLVVGYLIYWIVDDRTGDARKAENAFAIWFLCPVVIVVGAVGGMFDALVALLVLLSVIFVRRERFVLAGVFFATAVYLKLFPAFLMFPLLAYVFATRTDRDDRIRSLGKCVLGAVIATVLIFTPSIIQGHLADCVGFITSRFTQGMGGVSSPLVSIGTVVLYLAILVVSVYASVHLARDRTEDMDRRLMEVLAFTACAVFIYPAASQYILMAIPFLAMLLACGYRRLLVPMCVLFIGSTVMEFSADAVLLIPFANEFGFIDPGVLTSVINALHSSNGFVSVKDLLFYGGGVVQWIGVAWCTVLLGLHLAGRTDLKAEGRCAS